MLILFVSWVLLSFVLWIFSGNPYSHARKGLSHACIGENVSRTIEAEFLSLELIIKAETQNVKGDTLTVQDLYLICSSGFNSFLYNHLHLQPSSGIVTPVLSCTHVTAPIFCAAIIKNNLLLLSSTITVFCWFRLLVAREVTHLNAPQFCESNLPIRSGIIYGQKWCQQSEAVSREALHRYFVLLSD